MLSIIKFNFQLVLGTIIIGVIFMPRTHTALFDNTERYRELGYAISYYRKRKGLTQEQLAEKICISRQHMAGIEAPNMLRPTSLEVIFNIATVLEIEPYMLLKFNPDK